MAKNKDKKKREREKRVAKKKLVETVKRREQAEAESATTSRPRKVIEAPALQVPGANSEADQTDSRSPFVQRRLGG